MVKKRFEIKKGYTEHIIENNHPRIPQMFVNTQEVVNRLNELYEESEQLKAKNDGLEKDLQENVNIFKEFKKENEQLKNQNEMLQEELRQCKAVIDYRWNEYLMKQRLTE